MIPHGGDVRAGEWALRGRAVCKPGGIRPAAVLVRGERIAAVVGPDEVPAGVPVEDAGDKLVLPGLVDAHVHINEPGRTDWEGFATATRAAAAGGITALIDMPLNSSPVTTTVEALRLKQQAAAGKLWVDCGFHGGVVPGNADQIEPLIAEGVCAFKAFLCPSGIDEFPAATESDLRAVMPKLAAAGLPLFVHAELVSPLPAGVEEHFAANPRSYSAYLATRPPEWEVVAIRLMIELCREYRCTVHIVHLSAAEAAQPLIESIRAEGLPITFETCPHYLCFSAEDVPDGHTLFKCAPPIREWPQCEVLRQMIVDRWIETIGSDHSPAPPGMKALDRGDFRRAWGGISSLQLLLPATYSAFDTPDPQDSALEPQDSTFQSILRAISLSPAALVGLAGRKGAIGAGYDADLVIFDPGAKFVVEPAVLQHRHKVTPYLNRVLFGVVEATYLRGRKVYDHGHFLGEPGGQLLERPSRGPP